MKKATRNVVALDLASRKYALRIVAKAKGNGSYRRKEKHRTWKDGGASSVFGVRILLALWQKLGKFSLKRILRRDIVQGQNLGGAQ
jgi:stalled ribosome alternative rescue factor ArfA